MKRERYRRVIREDQRGGEVVGRGKEKLDSIIKSILFRQRNG